MAIVDPWMTGVDLTVLTVQPLQADVNGTVTTNGSALSFMGILEGARCDGHMNTEQINAIGNLWDNHVPVKKDDGFAVREIMRRGQGQINLLTIFLNTGLTSNALVTWTRSGNTTTFYSTIGPYREGGGREKWVAELQFFQTDVAGDIPSTPAFT